MLGRANKFFSRQVFYMSTKAMLPAFPQRTISEFGESLNCSMQSQIQQLIDESVSSEEREYTFKQVYYNTVTL